MSSNTVKKMPVQKVKVDHKIGITFQLIMTFITTIFLIVAFFKRAI